MFIQLSVLAWICGGAGIRGPGPLDASPRAARVPADSCPQARLAPCPILQTPVGFLSFPSVRLKSCPFADILREPTLGFCQFSLRLHCYLNCFFAPTSSGFHVVPPQGLESEATVAQQHLVAQVVWARVPQGLGL